MKFNNNSIDILLPNMSTHFSTCRKQKFECGWLWNFASFLVLLLRGNL